MCLLMSNPMFQTGVGLMPNALLDLHHFTLVA